MSKENRSSNSVWIIMMVLSLMLLAWNLLVLSFSRDTTLNDALRLAGSLFIGEDIDEAGLGFLNMAMLKPLWEEIWIGIFGIYCALALKKHRKDAWILGFFWGIMMITNAAIQGGYEVFVLKWRYPCIQTFFFFLLGVIPVVSLLITRRKFVLHSISSPSWPSETALRLKRSSVKLVHNRPI